jgi:hypothetical protein
MRVHNPINQEGKHSFWQLTRDEQMTLPEYIEGQAKGTVRKLYGRLYRLVIEDV